MKTFFRALLSLCLALGTSDALASYTPTTVTSTGATASMPMADRFALQYYAQDFGAKCDGHILADVTTTSGSANISSANYTFISADVGKNIYIFYPGLSAGFNGTISSVSGHNATLSATVGFTITGNAKAQWLNTDDTTAINNAIQTISQNGGGTLNFKGVCAASQIVEYRFVKLDGGQEERTHLVQIKGSNKDFLVSENLSALVGTGANYGTDSRVPGFMVLSNLHIDGNSTRRPGNTDGNTSGRGIAIYGNMLRFENVFEENAAGDGIFTQASGSYVYNLYDNNSEEEGHFVNVFARENGGKGWKYEGPHDGYMESYTGAANGDCGFYNDTNGVLYQGNVHIGFIHTYYEDNGCGQSFNAYTTIAKQYLDTDNGIWGNGSGGSEVATLNHLACGVHGGDCLTFNTGNIRYGTLTMAVDSTATSGVKVLSFKSDGSVSGVHIGSSYINMASYANPATSLYLRGTYNEVNGLYVTAKSGQTGQVGVDLSGNNNVVRGELTPVATAVAYTPGFTNRVDLSLFQGAGQVTMTGTAQSTDIFNFTNSNSADLDGMIVGNSFRTSVIASNSNFTMLSAVGSNDTQVSANTAVAANKYAYGVDTTGGAKTMTLPSPLTQQGFPRELYIYDAKGSAGTNAITVDAGTGVLINNAQTKQVTTAYGGMRLHGINATTWAAQIMAAP